MDDQEKIPTSRQTIYAASVSFMRIAGAVVGVLFALAVYGVIRVVRG